MAMAKFRLPDNFDEYIFARGATCKSLKEFIKKNYGEVSNLAFVCSYEFDDNCWKTLIFDWSDIVRFSNEVHDCGLLYVIGVCSTPFSVKAFDYPFAVC